MYALEILLVSWGSWRSGVRSSQPTPSRLVQFGAIVALLLYTQYWTLYLLLVVGVLLVALGLARPVPRRGAPDAVAMAIGGLAFVPWLPTFLYPARAHRYAVGHRAVPGRAVRLHAARLRRR